MTLTEVSSQKECSPKSHLAGQKFVTSNLYSMRVREMFFKRTILSIASKKIEAVRFKFSFVYILIHECSTCTPACQKMASAPIIDGHDPPHGC